MLIDAREIDEGRTLEADICVVGAGAAGISMARRFIGRGLNVLLLESGGHEYDDRTQDLYSGPMTGNILQNDHWLRSARLRYFGGTTNHWGGWCRELDSLDFKKRDWVPYSGWPIQKPALKPFYDEAAEVCQIAPFPENEKELPRLPRWEQPYRIGDNTEIETRVFHFSPPTRFGPVYRKELEDADDVTLLIHANALHLEASRGVHDGRRRVERLRVQAFDRAPFHVQARHYVLAAGGIENVRLLLNSNDVQRGGLGNENDQVGRYFMEHPHIADSAFFILKDSARLALYRDVKVHAMAYGTRPARLMGVFCPTDEFQIRERILSFSAQVTKVEHFGASDAPIAEMGRQMTHWGGNFRPAARRPNAYSLFVRSEQAPNPESRITLIRERDELGLRRVALDWRTIELDKRTLQKTCEALARILGQDGSGRVKNRVWEGRAWPEGSRGGRHHIGTTRMHDDPKVSVVDRDCRVHSVDNLFMAGSSVFTTGGLANPTFTIVALGLRLADHLGQAIQRGGR